MNEIISYIENEILKIKSEDCAFSISTKFSNQNIYFDFILNSEDTEVLLITTFLNLWVQYSLINEIDNFYQLNVSYDTEHYCTEIKFTLSIIY